MSGGWMPAVLLAACLLGYTEATTGTCDCRTLQSTIANVNSMSSSVEDMQQQVQCQLQNVNTHLGDERELLRQLRADMEAMKTIVEDIQSNQQNCAAAGSRTLCAGIYDSGERISGVYTVQVGRPPRPLQVYCDMVTDGGGWTVFQRRQDGSVNFERTWNEYASGFGNLNGEFWLGNDNIHLLTSSGRQELRVDLTDLDDNTRYAKYDSFQLGSAAEEFKLISLGTYSGTAGDALTAKHLGHKFSTLDNDNDLWTGSCAVARHGAWWYNHCHDSNLNGLYGETTNSNGVNWFQWKGYEYSMKATAMKIRQF